MTYRYGKLEKNEEDWDKDESEPKGKPDIEVSEKEAARRLEQIHQYLRDRAYRRDVIARTRTESGQELDWVPVESQTRNGRLASPPSEDGLYMDDPKKASDEHEIRPHELTVFELQRKGAELGPKGTVPLVRRDTSKIQPVRTLQDYLSKHGRALRILPDDDLREFAYPEDGTAHKYAYSAQYVTCYC